MAAPIESSLEQYFAISSIHCPIKPLQATLYIVQIDKAKWLTWVQTTRPQLLHKLCPGLMDSWTKHKICLYTTITTYIQYGELLCKQLLTSAPWSTRILAIFSFPRWLASYSAIIVLCKSENSWASHDLQEWWSYPHAKLRRMYCYTA